MSTPPRRLATDAEFAAALALIRESFAYMEGRIDPPSSMYRLTVADLAAAEEVCGIGDPLLACAVFTRRGDSLYLGKLAVRADARGKGLARTLVGQAEARARDWGLSWIELQTRIELAENHAAFTALGFERRGETAHPGFDRPTSVTFRKAVPQGVAPPPAPR